jgi:3-phenylpropionate/trans-cinnamate dioxygenase ferredoxin subunit
MPEFVPVGKAIDFKRGEIRTFEIKGQSVAVANCGGTVRAFGARCTHLDVELVDGFVNRDYVFCPMHDSCFDLQTGNVVSGPAANPLPIYAVWIQGDDVLVGVPD